VGLRFTYALLIVVALNTFGCAPRVDSALYASAQTNCPQAQLPSAEDVSNMPVETIRLRAQTAELAKQAYLYSSGQTCLGSGIHAETWSKLLRDRTGSGP
jgi:hypothetical protein